MKEKKFIVIVKEEPVTEENLEGLDITNELAASAANTLKAFCKNQKECNECYFGRKDENIGCTISGVPEHWTVDK